MQLLDRSNFRCDSNEGEEAVEKEKLPTPQSWYMFAWNWINNAALLIGVILMDLSIVEMFNLAFLSLLLSIFFQWLKSKSLTLARTFCYSFSHWIVRSALCHRQRIISNNQIPSQPRLSLSMCVFTGFRNRIIVSLFLLNFRLHDFVGHQIRSWMHFFSILTVLFRSNWVSPWDSPVLRPNCI